MKTINVLSGNTFVTSDELGNIAGTPQNPHGFFDMDTRFLSRWALSIADTQLATLSNDTSRHDATQFFLAPSTGTTYIDAPFSVVRRRSINGHMIDDIEIINHTSEQRDLDLVLEAEADFADLFEVKDALQKKGKCYERVEDNTLVLGYRREDYIRETRIEVETPTGANIEPHAIKFHAAIPGQSRWQARIRITPVVEALAGLSMARTSMEATKATPTWRVPPPEVHSDYRALERAYERGIDDLAALRLSLVNDPDCRLPAAGLPWFMAPFGRDSLITSYQAVPFLPELAEHALVMLARLQGERMDDFRDEEPGKILHELRFGELVAFEERPHSPYFGAADSTTLWLILLDEYERWSGRADIVRQLEPAARKALEWIDKYGDRDGDGYIEYERRNKETGLENQCWKDSWDSIVDSKGKLASFPRATCELQGYAYDAKVRCARLAREIWGDPALADALERQAADLKQRFNKDFWLEDLQYFALALDGEKRPVDALTSNIGHLLWSGIVADEHVAPVVAHLMGDRLFSGWGVRTLASGSATYNPIGYHVGTVWPHDNSLIAMGLVRYGYRDEAARMALAMFEAGTFFDDRLPETFAGYLREETHFPAEYPTACSPQAWASGVPLLMLRAILGMEPSGAQLKTDPCLPGAIAHVSVTGIPGRWGQQNVEAQSRDRIVAKMQAAAAGAPPGVRELLHSLEERIDDWHAHHVDVSVLFDLHEAGPWRFDLRHGVFNIDHVKDDADCTFDMSEQTLVELLHGRSPRPALLSGRVKVRGDVDLATRVTGLFLGARTGNGAKSYA